MLTTSTLPVPAVPPMVIIIQRDLQGLRGQPSARERLHRALRLALGEADGWITILNLPKAWRLCQNSWRTARDGRPMRFLGKATLDWDQLRETIWDSEGAHAIVVVGEIENG